jgi:hypothetical protein
MAPGTMATGKIIQSTAGENISGKMAVNMMGNGETISFMALVFIHGQMASAILANTIMT